MQTSFGWNTVQDIGGYIFWFCYMNNGFGTVQICNFSDFDLGEAHLWPNRFQIWDFWRAWNEFEVQFKVKWGRNLDLSSSKFIIFGSDRTLKKTNIALKKMNNFKFHNQLIICKHVIFIVNWYISIYNKYLYVLIVFPHITRISS